MTRRAICRISRSLPALPMHSIPLPRDIPPLPGYGAEESSQVSVRRPAAYAKRTPGHLLPPARLTTWLLPRRPRRPRERRCCRRSHRRGHTTCHHPLRPPMSQEPMQHLRLLPRLRITCPTPRPPDRFHERRRHHRWCPRGRTMRRHRPLPAHTPISPASWHPTEEDRIPPFLTPTMPTMPTQPHGIWEPRKRLLSARGCHSPTRANSLAFQERLAFCHSECRSSIPPPRPDRVLFPSPLPVVPRSIFLIRQLHSAAGHGQQRHGGPLAHILRLTPIPCAGTFPFSVSS